MSNIITSQQLFAHEQKLLQQAGSMNLKKAYTQPNGIGSLPQGQQPADSNYAISQQKPPSNAFMLNLVSPQNIAKNEQSDYVIVNQNGQQNGGMHQGMTKHNRFHIGIGGNAPNQAGSSGPNSYSIKSSTKRGRAGNDGGFNSYTDQQRYLHQG